VVLRGGVDHGLIIEDVLESLVDLRPAGILGQVASAPARSASRTDRSSA